MKRTFFIFILAMMNSFLYSQSDAIKFISMGFNAKQDYRRDLVYYFYGFNDYSEAIIFDDHIRLSTKTPGGFYPNGDISYGFSPYTYNRYNGKNNSIGYYWHIPTQGSYAMEYKFENGKLVYWVRGEGLQYEREPYTKVEKIEQNNQSITIYYMEDGRKYSEKYFNISKSELLDIFHKNYVKIICEIIDIGNTNKKYSYNFEDNFNEYISLLISSRTKQELAIFRNCLYAIKGYKFSNSTWTSFFNKYLEKYNGRYTNDEVKIMFTENEKWLLDLIIKYENGR
jgi:hypothetical protein